MIFCAVKDHEECFFCHPRDMPGTFFNTPILLSLDEAATDFLKLQPELEARVRKPATDQLKLSFLRIPETGSLSPGCDPNIRLLRVEGSILNILKDIYEDVRVSVFVEGLGLPVVNQDKRGYGFGKHISTKEMEVGDVNASCEKEITLPGDWFKENDRHMGSPPLQRIQKCYFRINITIEIPSQTAAMFSVFKKMLEEGIAADTVLVGGCGTEIKCHKCILSAHSTELAKNFQNDFKESKTGRIEMVDMSKEGIRAFLEFLYYWGTERPEGHSVIALELLQAGHKYNVAPLEKKMKQILLRMQNEWYDVVVGLRLFLFARNVAGCENIMEKSILVLKSKFKELQDLEEYKNLFLKDPKAAMQLCSLSLSV